MKEWKFLDIGFQIKFFLILILLMPGCATYHKKTTIKIKGSNIKAPISGFVAVRADDGTVIFEREVIIRRCNNDKR